MLNRSMAETIAQIGLKAMQKPTVISKEQDLGQAIAGGFKDWNDFSNKQSYIKALQGGNQEEIDKALAVYDPQAYAKVMEARQARENAVADADKQFERQKELARIKHGYDMGLAQFKKGDTTAMRNMEYLVAQGYTPQEAAQMYYSGQNPNASLPLLGEKGYKKYDENSGKNYAADVEAYRSMQSKLPELYDTVANLDKLGANATYTTAGQALDSFRRQTGMKPRSSSVDRSAYISIIDNQILPLLRDTFGAQFTEREGETLRKTLGDPDKHPMEKQAALYAFIRQKQNSIESQYRKIMSYGSPVIGGNEEVVEFTDL